MRTLKRNTQRMYYATFVDGGEDIYKLDGNGDKIISFIGSDGTVYYEVIGTTQPHYSEPVEFFGSISMSKSGEAENTEFGLNLGDYSAVLITAKNSIPIDEKSLIWHSTTPSIDSSGNVKEDSADYSVVKVSPSLNVDKYVLSKRIK